MNEYIKTAYKKHIAHNSFAIPVLIPSIGLLHCSQEFSEADVLTYKLLSVTGYFDINEDGETMQEW